MTQTWREQMLLEKWCQQTCHNPAICFFKKRGVIKWGMQHWSGHPRRTGVTTDSPDPCWVLREGNGRILWNYSGHTWALVGFTLSGWPSGKFWSSRITMHVCMCSVAQACPTLCDPMDCSPPGSSRHEILQARLLEWGAIPSSRGSSQPKDRTHVPCAAGGFFTAEPPGKPPEWQHTPSSPKPEPPTAWWYVLKLPSDQPYLILFQ